MLLLLLLVLAAPPRITLTPESTAVAAAVIAVMVRLASIFELLNSSVNRLDLTEPKLFKESRNVVPFTFEHAFERHARQPHDIGRVNGFGSRGFRSLLRLLLIHAQTLGLEIDLGLVDLAQSILEHLRSISSFIRGTIELIAKEVKA